MGKEKLDTYTGIFKRFFTTAGWAILRFFFQ